jgi:hypothetical protein
MIVVRDQYCHNVTVFIIFIKEKSDAILALLYRCGKLTHTVCNSLKADSISATSLGKAFMNSIQ